ncbi:MAG: hypothetical protein ACLFTQ_01840 [Candidatus Aenigmatarchaeota archaeon]
MRGIGETSVDNKGQQVLTAVLLTAVILTVSSSAYIWGRDMLEKTRDERNFEEMERFIRDLNENIKEVSRTGGRREMEIDLPEDAELRINEAESPGGIDNIILDFEIKGQMMATDTEIAVVGSKGTEAPVVRDPDVITASSTGYEDYYNIRFKLYYKNMTVEGEPRNRIGIDSTGRTVVREERASLIIEDLPTEEYGDDFTVNWVEIRLM